MPSDADGLRTVVSGPPAMVNENDPAASPTEEGGSVPKSRGPRHAAPRHARTSRRATATATAPTTGADPTTAGAGDGAAKPRTKWLITAGVALVYLGFSAFANGSAWTHGIAHSIQTSGGNDVPEEIWFLAQTPWVLLHGHNPLVNNWLNYPSGIDLMDNTTMPFFGILGFPITLLFGPIATFNILIDLAIFASAMSFFVMARRFVSWWPAAFVGGLVYGFSPYTAGTANAHLFLLFQAVPPLVILFVDRLLRKPGTSAKWGGLIVGLCFVVQFYVSTEVFATLVVMTGIALVLGAIYVWRTRITLDRRRLLTFAGCAVVVIALGVGYGAWLAVAGPHHITGPAQPASAIAGVSNDPVGLVVPTLDQRFTLGHTTLGNSLVAIRAPNWQIVFDAPIENGSYVGVPLLIALVVGAIALRRRRLALFSTAMAAIALVLSLGSHLHVDGHRTGIPLPFIVIAHVPLLDSSVASRWITYFWLFAALLLALILEAVYNAVAADRRADRNGATVLTTLLAVVVLLPLVPAWPYSAAASDVPAWFTSSARSLAGGSTALVYPIASSSNDQSMLWQAMANMAFKMPGGFAVIPGPKGANTFNGQSSPLGEALATCQAGGATFVAFPPAQTRDQLAQWQTHTVVVVPSAPGAGCAEALFTQALGPPHHEGGVLVWPKVEQTTS